MPHMLRDAGVEIDVVVAVPEDLRLARQEFRRLLGRRIEADMRQQFDAAGKLGRAASSGRAAAPTSARSTTAAISAPSPRRRRNTAAASASTIRATLAATCTAPPPRWSRGRR